MPHLNFSRLILLLATLCIALPLTAADRTTAREDAFLDWKFGMFLHFNMATFNEVEWANGYEDPASFSPDQFDADQWAQAAVDAGMRYVVLTVKHTGGWCLWDSATTESHAMSAFVNYQNGQGDIVREFVEACRKHGLKVGFYYCFPRDFGHPEDQPSLRGLPPEAKGAPLAFVKTQLTELLSNYGPIDLLWCDQYQFDLQEDWPEILEHVRGLQPECIIIANNSRDLSETDIHSYEYPWLLGKGLDALPPKDNTVPAEVCDKMETSWFWKAEDTWEIMEAAKIVDMLRTSNARRANYLLNIAPDRTGRIPAASVARLREVGVLLRTSAKQD